MSLDFRRERRVSEEPCTAAGKRVQENLYPNRGKQPKRVEIYDAAGWKDEPEGRTIGIWGQRHLRYIRKHKVSLYAELLTTGKLNDYLADLNEQAEAMFSRLVKQLSEKEGVTEALKADNQMLWVQRMNNIHSAAMEIVTSELIYC